MFAVLQDLLRLWSEEAHSFGVPSSSFGDSVLDILGSGILADFNGGREVLDGLFRIYVRISFE